MENFDLIVIGSGAGLMMVQAGLMKGLKCALIENAKFGGTCLTRGCIPSKMLVHPADMIREAQSGEKIGLQFEKPVYDWDIISKRMWSRIDFSKKMESSLDQVEGLSVFKGNAEFTGKKSMRVKYKDASYSKEFSGKTIVIAAGAKTFIPPIKGIDEIDYLTSETFFGEKYPDKPWDSLIIVGVGAVGAEFAHIFSSFGTKVTVIERNPVILKSEEKEISDFVAKQFEANGIEVLVNTNVIAATEENGLKTLELEDKITGEKTKISAQAILLSPGVRPNSDSLKLENTDIKTDAIGFIQTDEYLRTSQKDVYAIGDINGKYMLRHKANYEAEILMHNLFANKKKNKTACYSAVPWAVFTWPQVAHVGMTEAEARSLGIKCYVGFNHYSQIAGGFAYGIEEGAIDDGFVKIVVGENKNILGVHIVGPQAAILVQPFVYLMNVGFKCEKRKMIKKENLFICPSLGGFTPIEDSMVIHPALSELTAWAIDSIHWHD